MPTPSPLETQKTPSENDLKPKPDKAIAADSPAARFIESLVSNPAKREAKPAPEKKETAAPAAPPVKKKAAPTQSAQVIDEEKLGESIGRSIAKHAQPPREEKPAAEIEEDPDEQRRIAVMERMEQMHGDKYKGLRERYAAAKKGLEKYAADWEASNPGEEFDENDPQHEEVIKQLESEFDYDDHDYVDAQADIRAEEKIKGQSRELNERLSKVERREKAEAEMPKIIGISNRAGNEFWNGLGEEFAGVVTEKGEINNEKLKELEIADPIRHEIALGAAQTVELAARAMYMLGNGLADPETNDPVLNFCSQFALGRERPCRTA